MNNPRKLEDLIRGAFEHPDQPSCRKLATLCAAAERAAAERRRRRQVRRISLSLAALLALLAIPCLSLFQKAKDSSANRPSIQSAIQLLCEIDEVDDASLQAKSETDLLVAWQELPCRDLL